MFPAGFLGSRADILIDIVTLSFIVILPILIISWRMARSQKDYVNHRRIQLWLGISLAIVVSIFEYDLKMSGGIFEITKGSIYEGTALLNWTIYIHTFFSILTSIIWVFLIAISLFKFGNPPQAEQVQQDSPDLWPRRHDLHDHGRCHIATAVLLWLCGLTRRKSRR